MLGARTPWNLDLPVRRVLQDDEPEVGREAGEELQVVLRHRQPPPRLGGGGGGGRNREVNVVVQIINAYSLLLLSVVTFRG